MVVHIRTNLRLLAADLSKYVYKLLLSPGVDYSPWNQGQINWYQIGNKTCYIPKFSKFYLEKGYKQQITFITRNRFCLLSKTPLPSTVLN